MFRAIQTGIIFDQRNIQDLCWSHLKIPNTIQVKSPVSLNFKIVYTWEILVQQTTINRQPFVKIIAVTVFPV